MPIASMCVCVYIICPKYLIKRKLKSFINMEGSSDVLLCFRYCFTLLIRSVY